MRKGALIVIGHVIAVYLAHLIALRLRGFQSGDAEPVPDAGVDDPLHHLHPLDHLPIAEEQPAPPPPENASE
jgi:hypothetical protein